jgi:hypothetical protein
MAQVALAAATGMVAMGMGDHRFFNGLPGINVKVALCAVETFICKRN